jgi:hypothetical protein
VAVEACRDGLAVELVHLGGAAAGEGERGLVPGLPLPVGIEAAHDVLGVEHQAEAVRHRRLHVVVPFRELDPEQAVEGERSLEVGGDDPDRVELRHSADANR